MKLLRDEKGLAMPLALIVLLVLTLLGIALWQYSMSELNNAVREEKRARAYYIARAGAESVARFVMINPDVLDSIPKEIDAVITSESINYKTGDDVDVGDVVVELKRIASNKIEVTGIGEVDEVIQRVSLILETQEEFDGVVYATDGLNFQQNVTVNGDIVSGGLVKWQNVTVTEHPNSDYTLKDNTIIHWPRPEFPPPAGSYPGVINISNNSTGTPITAITSTHYPHEAYQSVTMGNNSNLTIDASSNSIFLDTQIFNMRQNSHLTLVTSADHDLIIVVDSITLRRTTILGDGTAKLYVRNSMNVQTPAAYVDDHALLEVYLDEGCNMTMIANAKFAGLVYGPQAIVTINGNADFEGSMIVSQLLGTNGSPIIGSSGTYLDHKYSWGKLGLDYGGYWMVHWIQ